MQGKSRKNTQLIILTFLIMIVLGFLTSLRGTLIPAIKDSFGVSYSDIGLMIFIADLGYMLATFFGGILSSRLGLKRILIFAFIVVTIGIVCLNYVHSFALLVLILFFITAGAGCFDICANSLGAALFVTNAAVMMNMLHFFFGAGSSASPGYAGILLSGGMTWKDTYTYSLLLVGAVFLLLIFTLFPKKDRTQGSTMTPVKDIIKDKRVWLFTAVLGFSIVAELGAANWLVNFLQAFHKFSIESSSFYLSLFFVIFTVGRMIGGFMAEKAGYLRLILYFAIAIFVFYVFGLLLGSGWAALFSLTGFFVSILYPTVITILIKEFKDNAAAVMGFVMTAATAVSMVCNWLIGKTSDIFGVWTGFASLLIYIALLVVSIIALKRCLESYGGPAVLQDDRV